MCTCPCHTAQVAELAFGPMGGRCRLGEAPPRPAQAKSTNEHTAEGRAGRALCDSRYRTTGLTFSAPDMPWEATWKTQSTPSKAWSRASSSRTSAWNRRKKWGGRFESKAETPAVHLARSQSWPDPARLSPWGPEGCGQDLHDSAGDRHQHQPPRRLSRRLCSGTASPSPPRAREQMLWGRPVDEDRRLREAEPVTMAAQLGSPGVELELKQPGLFILMLLVLPQILSPDLHPSLDCPPPRPSSLHLDELSPRGQLPLGSAEVKQDDRSASLGQAGT